MDDNMQNQTPQVPVTPQPPQNNGSDVPGKNEATVSLVLGIISIVLSPWYALIGLPAGIVGLFFSSKAKKANFSSGILTAGLICSIVGTCLNGIGLVILCCSVCTLGCAACGTKSLFKASGML